MENKIILGLGSNSAPPEMIDKLRKWAFLWLHEHGFEGELVKIDIEETNIEGFPEMECSGILIDQPEDWGKEEVDKLVQEFAEAVSNYILENFEDLGDNYDDGF